MKYRGKLLGAIIGLLLFGPIGMAFGFITGHLYDIGYFRAFFDAAKGGIHTQAQKVFFDNTFKIMGYIAKLDGRVSESEITTARLIMSKMGLNDALKQQAMILFSLGKKADFSIDQSLMELKQVCRLQPALLQIFLEIQLQMASADGGLTPAKRAALAHICAQLGVRDFQFNQQQHSQHQYQYQQRPRDSNDFTLNEAYEILGVPKTAKPDEIKTAYRRAMSQNHPDKLIAKGLPPEMIKLATQKTQRIKKAYEDIKKNRGF